MKVCYVALGANLNKPIKQLNSAVNLLKEHKDFELLAVSSLYTSKPMGPADQPDYVNAVAKIATSLAPEQILSILQSIELEHGRERKAERWGPRALDLDILLIDDLIIETDRLTVPHYGMKEREFVIYPLLEIAPNLILPDGCELASLSQHVENNLIKYEEENCNEESNN